VKTLRAPGAATNRRSHFGYRAFLFLLKVIRIIFSFFKIVLVVFSHSLSPEPTADPLLGLARLLFRAAGYSGCGSALIR
jgi:hypothetical protein